MLVELDFSRHEFRARKVHQLNCYLPPDFHQVHDGAPAGYQGWAEADVHEHLAGLPRHLQHAAVEADAVRGVVPAHHGAGEAQVRTSGLEHPVRVQHLRLQRQRAVRPEPPGRHGHQEGQAENDGKE